MSKKNKSWSLEDKLAILKENLVEGKSVADICEAKGLSPSLFYTWREALFKPNVSADEKRNQRKEISKVKALEDSLAKSEAKIMLKNEVIAELLEEYTKVKKSWIYVDSAWTEQVVRDEVLDFIKHWSARAEVDKMHLLAWLALAKSTYSAWLKRYR